MRRAFTLIELIFVIVIIGILAAVAIPKFVNLKQNAEANNVVKVIKDSVQGAVEAATNLYYLEGNTSFTLKDILHLNGKNWGYTDSVYQGQYFYRDPTSTATDNQVVADIFLIMDKKQIVYDINCSKFGDPETQNKCISLLGGKSFETYVEVF